MKTDRGSSYEGESLIWKCQGGRERMIKGRKEMNKREMI